MQLAAEFGTGQVLWSIIWFFLFFIWIMLIFQVFGDIFRSHNSGVSKALWTMAQRQAQSMQKNDEAMQAYIRDAAGTGTTADELAKLAELHNSGKLDDTEFAAAKARLING